MYNDINNKVGDDMNEVKDLGAINQIREIDACGRRTVNISEPSARHSQIAVVRRIFVIEFQSSVLNLYAARKQHCFALQNLRSLAAHNQFCYGFCCNCYFDR